MTFLFVHDFCSSLLNAFCVLKFHVCETKWANIEQLTVFICFAIEQEFVVVVLQEASSSLFSLHIHESGKTLLAVSSHGS